MTEHLDILKWLLPEWEFEYSEPYLIWFDPVERCAGSRNDDGNSPKSRTDHLCGEIERALDERSLGYQYSITNGKHVVCVFVEGANTPAGTFSGLKGTADDKLTALLRASKRLKESL